MKTAVYPGSFDPVTNGHMDVIHRAAALFDRVVVLVASNPLKSGFFTVDERIVLLARCTAALPNVAIDSTGGLVAHYARDIRADVIVKGLRAMTDFEFEFQQALANRQLNPYAETIFLPASGNSMYLSSGMVKQVCALGGDIGAFVPQEALPLIIAKIQASK